MFFCCKNIDEFLKDEIEPVNGFFRAKHSQFRLLVNDHLQFRKDVRDDFAVGTQCIKQFFPPDLNFFFAFRNDLTDEPLE